MFKRPITRRSFHRRLIAGAAGLALPTAMAPRSTRPISTAASDDGLAPGGDWAKGTWDLSPNPDFAVTNIPDGIARDHYSAVLQSIDWSWAQSYRPPYSYARDGSSRMYGRAFAAFVNNFLLLYRITGDLTLLHNIDALMQQCRQRLRIDTHHAGDDGPQLLAWPDSDEHETWARVIDEALLWGMVAPVARAFQLAADADLPLREDLHYERPDLETSTERAANNNRFLRENPGLLPFHAGPLASKTERTYADRFAFYRWLLGNFEARWRRHTQRPWPEHAGIWSVTPHIVMHSYTSFLRYYHHVGEMFPEMRQAYHAFRDERWLAHRGRDNVTRHSRSPRSVWHRMHLYSGWAWVPQQGSPGNTFHEPVIDQRAQSAHGTIYAGHTLMALMELHYEGVPTFFPNDNWQEEVARAYIQGAAEMDVDELPDSEHGGSGGEVCTDYDKSKPYSTSMAGTVDRDRCIRRDVHGVPLAKYPSTAEEDHETLPMGRPEDSRSYGRESLQRISYRGHLHALAWASKSAEHNGETDYDRWMGYVRATIFKQEGAWKPESFTFPGPSAAIFHDFARRSRP